MPVKGRVISIGQSYGGNRKSDGQPWRKQEYVIETAGKYPKKVAFVVMNDKIDEANMQVGHTVEIEIDASSREYNGKWYTELTAWRINNLGVVQPPSIHPPVYEQQAPQGYQSTTTASTVNNTTDPNDPPF